MLEETDALILAMPRRCVATLLRWFDDLDDGEDVTLACRAEIEDRIQKMIDCLDDFDGDADLETEPLENDADGEEDGCAG